MSLHRDVAGVLDSMLAVIPSEETALRSELESIRRHAPYVAPEIQHTCWRDAQLALVARFGHLPREEWPTWETTVRSIFMGDSVNDDREVPR